MVIGHGFIVQDIARVGNMVLHTLLDYRANRATSKRLTAKPSVVTKIDVLHFISGLRFKNRW
jgi:hypothetical protein